MGNVRTWKRTAGVVQTAHVNAITDQPQTLLKLSQKLVAIAKILSQKQLYTSEQDTMFSPGLAGACLNSLDRLPVLLRRKPAGGQGENSQSGKQQSLPHKCHCHKTGTARETQPYEWDDLWGSAEKLFWSEHTAAGQLEWFYCSWNALYVLQIKSNYKASLFWVTINSLALHRQTAGRFYLSMAVHLRDVLSFQVIWNFQKKSLFLRKFLLVNSWF